MGPVAVPKHPLVILTPRPATVPTEEGQALLRRMVRSILASDTTYSITYSEVQCPAGSNWFYTQKPYYWLIDGKWVHRDGHRNPIINKIRCQAQLDAFARTIRILTLALLHVPDLREVVGRRIEHLLKVFFVDDETRMNPEIFYSQCNPSVEPLQGDPCWVISCRFLLLIAQSLGTLQQLDFAPSTLAATKSWFQAFVAWTENSDQGRRTREYDNNIGVWYYTLHATSIAYVDPLRSEAYAQEYLRSLRTSRPTPDLYFLAEIKRTRPRHYTLFTLEPTFLIADIAGHPAEIVRWLGELVEYARTVKAGEIEVDVDNDERFFAKLRWFEKMLDRWNGGEAHFELDGRPWEGGWTDFERLSWESI